MSTEDYVFICRTISFAMTPDRAVRRPRRLKWPFWRRLLPSGAT